VHQLVNKNIDPICMLMWGNSS